MKTNMSIVDFQYHSHIFAHFCHQMLIRPPNAGIWHTNNFQRLLQMANVKGLFSPQNTQIDYHNRYYFSQPYLR